MVGGLGGQPPRAAQFYQVACVQGHRLRGERTEGYQALRCPTCGDGIFVLPRSPLPEPPASAPAASRARAGERAAPRAEPAEDDDLIALTDPLPESAQPVGAIDPDAEIDWREPEAPARPTPAPATAAPRPAPSPGDSARPRETRAARPAAKPARPQVAMPVLPRETWGEWARRNRTPLLTAGAVAIVALALVVRQGRQRLEQLPRIAELGRTEGLAKLDAGEFHAAKKLLSDAAAAVDGLGGRVEGAEEIRQGAQEAAIYTDLVPESLERIVEEAVTFREQARWSAHFKTLYRGRSVVIDAPLVEVPDPAKPGSGYRVDYRLLVGKGPRPDATARIDFAGFTLFEKAGSQVGEQKPFGARLATLELNTDSNEWVITLEPDSGVFLTHPRALEAIGWPTPEPPSEEPQP